MSGIMGNATLVSSHKKARKGGNSRGGGVCEAVSTGTSTQEGETDGVGRNSTAAERDVCLAALARRMGKHGMTGPDGKACVCAVSRRWQRRACAIIQQGTSDGKVDKGS